MRVGTTFGGPSNDLGAIASMITAKFVDINLAVIMLYIGLLGIGVTRYASSVVNELRIFYFIGTS